IKTITDASPDPIAETLRHYGIDTLIHGHTNRPAIHELEIEGLPHRRIVLGDWYEQGSVLRERADGGFDLSTLSPRTARITAKHGGPARCPLAGLSAPWMARPSLHGRMHGVSRRGAPRRTTRETLTRKPQRARAAPQALLR